MKYYENTKYALNRKVSKKIDTIVLHVNVGFFSRTIEMRRKWNIGAECKCIANSMVTFLKFLLTYSMKFAKIYSIR